MDDSSNQPDGGTDPAPVPKAKTSAKPEAAKKDRLDFLQIIGTLASPIILVFLTYFLNRQAEEVKQSISTLQGSIAKAQLVHTLGDDLHTTGTRQDFALIALNRSIGDEADPRDSNRLMVVEIAKAIFADRIRSNNDADPSTYVSFLVLQERCGPKGKPGLCGSYFDGALALVKDRAQADHASAISDKDAKPASSVVGPPPKPIKNAGSTQILASAFSGVVYIQYADPADQARAEALRAKLNAASGGQITAPGAEYVIGNYCDSVRYFHSDDVPISTTVKGIVDDFFRDQHRAPFKTVDYSPRSDVPHHQLEVWIAAPKASGKPAC